MNSVRLNITLPREVAEKLDALAGRKGKSSFIAECIRQKIAQLERERLRGLLIEGYESTKKEGLSITREFEPLDIEGWDEY